MDKNILDELSPENKTRIADVLGIIINELELEVLNRLEGNSISWGYFLAKNYSETTVLAILDLINKKYPQSYIVWNNNSNLIKTQVELIGKPILMRLYEESLGFLTEQDVQVKFEEELDKILFSRLRKNLIMSIGIDQFNKLKKILVTLENQIPNKVNRINQIKRKEVKILDAIKRNGNEYYTDDFIWTSDSENGRGILVMKNKNAKPIIFKAGNFGGLDQLFINFDHDVKRDQLRQAIVENKQGSDKSSKQISASGWVFELKRKRPEFFKYFNINYYKPDNYKLELKSV